MIIGTSCNCFCKFLGVFDVMISVLYVNILIWVLICLDACMLKWSLGCLSKQIFDLSRSVWLEIKPKRNYSACSKVFTKC